MSGIPRGCYEDLEAMRAHSLRREKAINRIQSIVRQMASGHSVYAIMMVVYADPVVTVVYDRDNAYMAEVHITNALKMWITANRKEVTDFLDAYPPTSPVINIPEDF